MSHRDRGCDNLVAYLTPASQLFTTLGLVLHSERLRSRLTAALNLPPPDVFKDLQHLSSDSPCLAQLHVPERLVAYDV